MVVIWDLQDLEFVPNEMSCRVIFSMFFFVIRCQTDIANL